MNLKKFLSLLAAATMAVTALTGAMTASAETVAEGTCGPLEWTLDSEGKLTISGEGGMASPSVPNVTVTGSGRQGLVDLLETELKDYPEIYTYKEYTEDIKEVVIKEGVTTIGFAAFYKMPNLEKVTLPSTIKEFKGIGFDTHRFAQDAHSNSDSSAYASLAFAECKKLTDLTLTEGMTAIGGIAFYGCTSLDNVRIPSTILYEESSSSGLKSNYGWGPYSFVECSSLKNLILPEGLKVIGAGAFEYTGLRSVVIPSTIENWSLGDTYYNTTGSGIYSSAFANCTRLSSVTFADGLKIIGQLAFQGCTSLKKVGIPSSVTNLTYAFAYCNGLEEAYIDDGAQIAGAKNTDNNNFQYSFYNCTNLKRIEIPAGVNVSYTNPQWCTGCTSLTDIYLHGKDYTLYIPDIGNTPNYHCYFDTDTYNRALVTQSKIPEDRIVNIEEEIAAYLEMVKTNLDKAKTYDEELYTPESYGVLKALIEKAESFGEDSSILAMEWTASDITTAIRGLEKKPEETPSDPSDDTSEPSLDPTDDPSEPTSDDPSNPSDNPTQPTSAPTTAKPAPTPTAPTTAAPKATTAPTVKTTVTKPAKVTKLKATAKKKKLNVSWKKVSGATGYEVLSATNNKFTKNKKTVDVKKNKAVIKKLKAKKKYFVKVRAYKTVNGTKYYGKWSKVVKKKTK